MLDTNKITIWQQNLNKSPTCQHDLLSSNKLTTMNIDVIALQEPAIINGNHSIAARDWILVYPTPHLNSPKKMRSLMLINAQISTDSWNQLDFPSVAAAPANCWLKPEPELATTLAEPSHRWLSRLF